MRGSRAIPPTSERPNVTAKYAQLKKVFSGFLGSGGFGVRLFVGSFGGFGGGFGGLGCLCPFAPFFLLVIA